MMSTDQIIEFRQVTGSDEETATRYLSACNSNLEMAVSLFMDNPNIVHPPNAFGSDDNYRSPIPQRTEQLLPIELPIYASHFHEPSMGVRNNNRGITRTMSSRTHPAFLVDDSDDSDSSDDNRNATANGENIIVHRQNIRRGHTSVLNGRSGSRPTANPPKSGPPPAPTANGSHTTSDSTTASSDQQGASCSLPNGGTGSGICPSAVVPAPGPLVPHTKHRREHLRQLYRPPTELLFDGTMLQAAAAAREKPQWLLVSLHDEGCFDCHILNRDVWKDTKVFMLLKRNFTFMQIWIDSPEGVRYRTRYPYVQSATHMAVLDPSTGEQKMMWMHLKDAETVYEILSEFLTHTPITSADSCQSSSSTVGSHLSVRRPAEDITLPSISHKRPRLDTTVSGISMGFAAVSSQLVGGNTSAQLTSCNNRSPRNINPLDLSEEEQLRMAIEASKAEVTSKTDPGEDHADAQSAVGAGYAEENGSSCNDDELIVVTDDDDDDFIVRTDSDASSRPANTHDDCFIVNAPTEGGTYSTTALISGRRPLWAKPKEDTAVVSIASTSTTVPHSVIEPLPTVSPGEEPIELAIRLPDGNREVVSLSPQLTLQVIQKHFDSRGFPAQQYELIRLYPRSVISQFPQSTTLRDMGLAKKDTVFLQHR